MSPRGRRASLPESDHTRPEPLGPDGLIVHHYNKEGRLQDYDFSGLLVAEPFQRSLAVLFAARCTPDKWSAHGSSRAQWRALEVFTKYLAEQERPLQDLDYITGSLIDSWWKAKRETAGGRQTFRSVCALLRRDVRLQTGPVADSLARRIPATKSKTRSYSPGEFEGIKTQARRDFRSALLRIEENAEHLERWRAGAFVDGSRDWIVGEGLDVLVRTGDVPRTVGPSGQRSVAKKYRRAMGGSAPAVTLQRLFLSRMEAVAMGVLLMAEYGWNLSIIDQAEVPKASPDPGLDARPTYRIPVEKRRRGAGSWYETESVTDHGADSPGRLITQALQATRFARAAVEAMAPGTDRLVVWRKFKPTEKSRVNQDRHPPVGPFSFGFVSEDAREWARAAGLGGSPFRRGRRTVNAVERREPAQHTQGTHDRNYALPDWQVQENAVPVIADGAEAALQHARRVVLVAELRDTRDPADHETATADCSNPEDSPFPAPDGGCGASFLMCLGCPNARIHTDHHPRLIHLHEALGNARSVLPPGLWQKDWGDTHARLADLKTKIGDGGWARGLARVTEKDRKLIDYLLTGDLNP